MKKIHVIFTVVILLVTINACTPEDTCKNGVKDSTETGVDCGGDCSPCYISNLEYNGATIEASSTKAELSNKFTAGLNGDQRYGLGLAATFVLPNGSTLSVGFYNDNVNSTCLELGAHTTSIDEAFSATTFKYSKVVVTNSDGYFFSEGKVTDSANLISCDDSNKTFSGEFSAKVKHTSSGDIIEVSGSFTDILYSKLY